MEKYMVWSNTIRYIRWNDRAIQEIIDIVWLRPNVVNKQLGPMTTYNDRIITIPWKCLAMHDIM